MDKEDGDRMMRDGIIYGIRGSKCLRAFEKISLSTSKRKVALSESNAGATKRIHSERMCSQRYAWGEHL